MIKIIKTGTRKQIECPECGCLFSYEQEDIQDSYTNANGIFAEQRKTYVECPQCKKEVTLKEINMR